LLLGRLRLGSSLGFRLLLLLLGRSGSGLGFLLLGGGLGLILLGSRSSGLGGLLLLGFGLSFRGLLTNNKVMGLIEKAFCTRVVRAAR